MPSPNSDERVAPHDRAPTRPSDEFAVVERLRRCLPAPPEGAAGEVWIGDDAAVLRPPGGRLLVSSDLQVAGVHADLGLMAPEDVGWRSVATAVSDIAAMGGTPLHLLVALAASPATDIDGLFHGIAEAAAAYGSPVVGGDLSQAAELVVAVTVTGMLAGEEGPVLRSGASAGDALLVTGPLGASAAGLRLLRQSRAEGEPVAHLDDPVSRAVLDAHRRPRARVEEGMAARSAGATAMIDVSDGFAADLWHIADASGVGFDVCDVPVAAGATPEEALGGGEDYELVIATPSPSDLAEAFARAGLRAPLVIGVCTDDPTKGRLDGTQMERSGWRHGFGDKAAAC